MSSSAAVSSRPVATATLILLALAVGVGATGRLAAVAPPGPQLIILALVAAAVALGMGVRAVRSWVDALPLRVLVGVHAVRFVGISFLILAARGELSPLFAARAGWGDLAAAVLALALIAAGEPATRRRRALYLAWNAFALLDLVVAVGTAWWVATRGLVPGMEPVLRLPLSLVPTFLVPMLVASHVFIFRRLLAGTGDAAAR